MKERFIFAQALEIEDPAERASYVRSACEGDAALIQGVEELLDAHVKAGSFMDTPACGDSIADPGSAADDDVSLGFLAPSSRPGSLGKLGEYEILKVIGQGACGIVLKAFDETLQRVVAIKVMAPQLAATSPARKRFIREARASAAIQHEHIVRVIAVEEKPIPFLVMEYISGQTLQQRLEERGPIEVAEVLRLGSQIAEGLAAAHARTLIHRDIKPGNILLDASDRDRVKITDFGLARAADDASITQSGMIVGTPMYMAPEQALGKQLDQRADLFSLGSVLYQMVSGRPPFRAASTLAVLKRLTEDAPRPITEIIPETPDWLCKIIARLHAKNPDERYQSAREIADELARWETLVRAHTGLKEISSLPAPEPPRRQMPGWIAGALTILSLVLALTGIGALVQRFAGRQQELAAAPAPASVRIPSCVVGNWLIDGEVLGQTGAEKPALLVFGNSQWTDGDFTCEVWHTTKDVSPTLLVRATDDTRHIYAELGGFGNTLFDLQSVRPAGWARLASRRQGIRIEEWVPVKVQLRGTSIQVFVDGKLTMQAEDGNHLSGAIGLRTWGGAAKFRNIRFTDPKGEVLWEGLPDLPAMASTKGQDANVHQSGSPESTKDHLLANTVWAGTRTYRKGFWAGKTVTYELHILERSGTKFKGHVFDNGPRRNKATVEGELNKESIAWREQTVYPQQHVNIQGVLAEKTIRLTLVGERTDGSIYTEGDGELEFVKDN